MIVSFRSSTRNGLSCRQTLQLIFRAGSALPALPFEGAVLIQLGRINPKQADLCFIDHKRIAVDDMRRPAEALRYSGRWNKES